MRLHVAIGSEPWSIAQTLALMKYQEKNGYALWQETAQWFCVASDEILTAVTHSHCKAGVLTLIPFHLRVKKEALSQIPIPSYWELKPAMAKVASLSWLLL